MHLHARSLYLAHPVTGKRLELVAQATEPLGNVEVRAFAGLAVQFVRECAAQGQGTVTSLLRVVERIGSILGPLLVALLIKSFGFSEGAMILGLTLAAIAACLAVYFYVTRPRILTPSNKQASQ